MGKRKKRQPAAPEWRESKQVKRQDELRFERQILATLRWSGCFSFHATGTAPEGRWTFDRPRVLSSDVEIHDIRADTPVATLNYGVFKADMLNFADGRVLRWQPTDFWQSKWAFFTPEGMPVARFADTSRLFETRTRVTFLSPSLPPTERALLALLGRYLMEMHRRDSIVVTAASTAAVV